VVTQREPELTNAGYSLAADAGLLFARALLRHHPGVRWDIVRKPKRDMAFQLPVLVGLGPVYLDAVGGSIADFQATLRGERGPRLLLEGSRSGGSARRKRDEVTVESEPIPECSFRKR